MADTDLVTNTVCGILDMATITLNFFTKQVAIM
jgi:hypothetical protein